MVNSLVFRWPKPLFSWFWGFMAFIIISQMVAQYSYIIHDSYIQDRTFISLRVVWTQGLEQLARLPRLTVGCDRWEEMNIELVDDQRFWLERIRLDISPQKDEIEFLLESLTPIFFGGGEIRDANNVTDAQMFHFSGWAKRNKQLYQLYFHMTSEKIRKQLSAKRFLQNVELSMFFHGKTIPFKKNKITA